MEAVPPALPPMPESIAQGIRDEEHLRILGIGYYIVGGFTALFASVFIIHVIMGLIIVSGAIPLDPPPHPPLAPRGVASAVAPQPSAKPFSPSADAPSRDAPFSPDRVNQRHPAAPEFPRAVGYLFVILGAIMVSLGWTVGALTIYAGRCLRLRRHRMFTLVVAGINCLHVPFGTALGVFTFVVLQRPSVVALYPPRPALYPPVANV